MGLKPNNTKELDKGTESELQLIIAGITTLWILITHTI